MCNSLQLSIEWKTIVSKRMAMVETSDDRDGVVVHRSISQSSGANQDPRSDRAIDANYFSGGSGVAVL